MILEIAILDIREGPTSDFEEAFGMASHLIASIPGYRSHELQRRVETPNRYALLVQWESLAAHSAARRFEA